MPYRAPGFWFTASSHHIESPHLLQRYWNSVFSHTRLISTQLYSVLHTRRLTWNPFHRHLWKCQHHSLTHTHTHSFNMTNPYSTVNCSTMEQSPWQLVSDHRLNQWHQQKKKKTEKETMHYWNRHVFKYINIAHYQILLKLLLIIYIYLRT